MNRWLFMAARMSLLMLDILACRTPAHAQTGPTVLWVDCGGEDERPCAKDDAGKGWGLLPANTPSDNQGGNFSDRLRCDSGLKIHQAANNTLRCTNFTRLLVADNDTIWNPAWETFARMNQNGTIQADTPIVYAPILGTHNSYSNYADGGDSSFSVDQGLSITNQLQLGARTIRLDPWPNYDYTYGGVTYHGDNQIILCHSSNGFTIPAMRICSSTDWQGKKISRNRSFIFAIKEIAHWLKQHPGEFIILRLHDYYQNWDTMLNGLVTVDQSQGTFTADAAASAYFDDAIQYGLKDMVYKNPSGVTGSSVRLAQPDDYRYPSLRELRASGKQVLIISSFQSEWTFQDQNGSTGQSDNTKYGVTGTGISDIAAAATVLSSTNCAERSISQHPTAFANIGEDRSISQLLVNDFTTSDLTSALLDTPKITQALACGYNWMEADFLDTLNQAPNMSGIVNFFSVFGLSNLPTALNYTCDDYSAATCTTADHRREAMIWSWHPGEGTANEPAQMTRGFGTPFGSWVSRAATSTAAYLCSAPQTINGASDATYDDDRQWYITNTTGRWEDGETACQAEKGGNWHFWRPQSAIQNMRAWTALSAAQNGNVAVAWINHYVGGIRALPKDVSYTLAQGATTTATRTIVVSGGFGGKLTVTSKDPNVIVTPANLYAVRDSSQTDDNTSNMFVISLAPAVANLGPGGHDIPLHVHEDYTLGMLTLSGTTTIPKSSDADFTVHVTIQPPTQVVIHSDPEGRNIFVDGQSYTAPQSFSWAKGSAHVVSAPLFETISTGEQAQFASWSDGLGATHQVTTPATGNSLTLTASYTLRYLLTLTAGSGGILQTIPASPDSYFTAGSPVQIAAVPLSGYNFTGFGGDLSGTANPQSLTMNGPHSVSGGFQLGTATVRILANAYKVPVIVDGASYPSPATFQWTANTTHTLSFAPLSLGAGERAVFSQWADGSTSNPRTITAADGTTLTPMFSVQWMVTTSVNPPGAGQVTGAGWATGGSPVQFTATAGGGYAFSGFSGGIQGTVSPQSVVVNAPLTVTASFIRAQPQFNVMAAVLSDLDPFTVELSLVVKNEGSGTAAAVNMAAVPAVSSGNGTVSVKGSIAPVASIAGGGLAIVPLTLNWPLTAREITLTVNYTADGGGYHGTQTLTITR